MFEQGCIIWAKTNKKLWPAITLSASDISVASRPNHVWVFWFGDYRVSEIKESGIVEFEYLFKQNGDIFEDNGVHWATGVYEAIKVYGYPDTNAWNNEELMKWAKNGFQGYRKIERCLPEYFVEKLLLIQVKPNSPLKPIKNGAQLRKSGNNIEDICIGCYSKNIIGRHPTFHGNICKHCKEKLKASVFHIGEDSIHFCCFICGNFGEVLVCSIICCGKSFCYRCLENLSSVNIKKLVSNKQWNCFICCEDSHANEKILKPRNDWRAELNQLFHNNLHPIPNISLQKRKIRVLSLFDGISSGYTALTKINISIDKYFASEVDQDAINISKSNHGNNIIQLGDVTNLDEDILMKICPIDLVIGGSPCNELSLANPDRKGVEDSSGSGILFFYFYKILMLLKRINNGPFFWLFENVASMTTNSKDIISRFLQTEPTKIDASWVSPQIRERFFWGNCPSLQCNFNDEGPDLQEFLEPGRKALVKKIDTVTTRTNSLLQGTDQEYPVMNIRNELDTLTINELENVFGFDKDYTNSASCDTIRQTLVGKAWSIQMVCMLLHFLKFYFKENDAETQ